MSKKLFTPQEIEQLKQNEYVKSVSEKGITYTKEFKENFITMSEKRKCQSGKCDLICRQLPLIEPKHRRP